jgi:hypothetical protein
MKRLALVLCSAVVVVGCTKRVPRTPPEAFLTLGGKKVMYRAWGTVDDLCLVNQQQFTDEQAALTSTLAQWLGQTSATVDGAWDDEHLALLEEGVRELARPLDVQKTALEQAKVCRFEGLASAAELNAQAIRRIEEAPEFIEQVKARLALAKWKEARPTQEASAKDSQCRTKAKPPAPILYFAAEDEHANIEWLFCDGSKVIASPGNPPAWRADPNAKKTKKEPDPKLWLDVVANYPPEQVSRAPKLKRKKTKRENSDEEPI